MKNIKKSLAFFLALVMVLSLVPITALAEDTSDQIDVEGGVLYYDDEGKAANSNNFVVSTSKTIAPGDAENEFDITLEVKTTVDVKKIKMDPDAAVVLVIDTSGSMGSTLPGSTKTRLDAAKEAAVAFIDSYVTDAGDASRKLSIVTFYGIGAGSSKDPYKGYSEVVLPWLELTNDGAVDNAKSVINGLKAQLGTFTQGGLMLARNLYLPGNAPISDDGSVIDNRFVILLTDGNPTHMLGTSNSNATVTSTSIADLTGNRLDGVENTSNVPAGRGASAVVADQIKNGGFKSNYTAKIFTIGFGLASTKYANTNNGKDSSTGDHWLQTKIATDQAHYTVANAGSLNLAFSKISEKITRIANAWKVTDPMAEYIDYVSDDSIVDGNKASFSDNTLSWSINSSDPSNTEIIKRGNVKTTIYTYTLEYSVVLDNLSGYTAQDSIFTNGRTYLEYIMSAENITLGDDDSYIEADFTIPKIHGFAADLEFTKIDSETEEPIAGAEFTLYYGEDAVDTVTSDDDGLVEFTGIPSGHEFTLVETKTASDEYADNDTAYNVAVDFGELTSDLPEDLTITNTKIKTLLEIVKVWIDEDGQVTTDVDEQATFWVLDENRATYFSNAITEGEVEVEPGTYIIEEEDLTNYSLVKIEVDGVPLDDPGQMWAEIEIPEGGKVVVTFTNEYDIPELEGNISLAKTVLDDDTSYLIANWLIGEGLSLEEIEVILADISFDIFNSNKDGEDLGQVADVTGIIDPSNSTINFYEAPDVLYEFDEGWYLVRENIGSVAAEYFQDPIADLLIYFNGETVSAKTGQGGATVDPDSVFTITQHKEQSRPLQAIYKDTVTGELKYLRNSPALQVDNRPNNGGGALGTSRFTATSNDGTEYMSFCADIGAIGVKGKYFVDEDKHGLSDDEVLQLVAALDYIYAKYGFDAEAYEGIALAQLVVWNLLLQYTDDPMIADLWLRDIAAGLLYTEAWGELIKIDGYNNSNGKNNWYTPEYKADIDDIIENAGTTKYVDLYKARVTDETGSYVSGVVFLKGDGLFAEYYQQRQVLVLFDDPAVVTNIPKDNGNYAGIISLDKVVLDDGQQVGFSVWLSDNVPEEDIAAILDAISFEIYHSDVDGNVYDQLEGVSGVIDGNSINFYKNSVIFDQFETGWYLVREVLESPADEVFSNVADLVIYFDAVTDTVIGNSVKITPIPQSTTFTITQHKEQSRPLQAIYKDTVTGELRYLRNAPALDVDNRPNNGGGALATSRFTASGSDGHEYMSFCADIGAIGVKGKYHIDPDKFGFTDLEIEYLVAALDFIYARSGFAEYEDIALAQIVVWNMLLQYTDYGMIADKWLRDISTGLLYTEAWGELIKIEGYNNSNGSNYWYTPEYKALVDDILANPDAYVELYKEAVRDSVLENGRKMFVGGAVFLKGDGSYADYYQQRQILIQFGDSPVFENQPKPEVIEHTVTFLDWDGTIIDVQSVADGEAAIAPTGLTREGYTFTGWDVDFDSVTSDLTVTAQYESQEPQDVEVVFIDWDGSELSVEVIPYGTSVGAPSAGPREGYTFIGWGRDPADTVALDDSEFDSITSDMVFYALYEVASEPEQYDVVISNAVDVDDILWSGTVEDGSVLPVLILADEAAYEVYVNGEATSLVLALEFTENGDILDDIFGYKLVALWTDDGLILTFYAPEI